MNVSQDVSRTERSNQTTSRDVTRLTHNEAIVPSVTTTHNPSGGGSNPCRPRPLRAPTWVRVEDALAPKSAPTESEGWHPARLIPTAGIKQQEEQEKRATSALLAVMAAVPEFGHGLLHELGAPKGKIATYAEVQLKDPGGRTSIPDGAIVVTRANKSWKALVEVKTGAAELRTDQYERYLDMTRQHGFDALLTITNQIRRSDDDIPVAFNKRKAGRLRLRHFSWWRILTTAVVQHRFKGIDDQDQAWILGELIAYLDHENSGASGFHDMGSEWVRVRDGVRAGTLGSMDREAREIATRWEQFIEYVCLGLSQDLGRDVQPAWPRRQSPEARLEETTRRLVDEGVMAGAVRVPDAVGDLRLEADLRSQQLTTSVALDAPRDRRPTAALNWLLRQVKEAPDDLRMGARFAQARETTALLLGEAREQPKALLSQTDAKREPRELSLALSRPLGRKRGRGKGSFVTETMAQTIDFYREIVQDLRAWSPTAPKLRQEAPERPETPPSPEPPPFSDVDERDPGDASSPG